MEAEKEAGSAAGVEALAPALRRLIRGQGLTVIRPMLGIDGVAYPEADALFSTNGARTERLLELLASLGVLEKVFIGSARTFAGEAPLYLYILSGDEGAGSAGGSVELPPPLARTLRALRGRGRATAQEVALETGRSRSLESVYLNQLVIWGLASKRRVGRRVYFEASSEEGGARNA
jgi:hypothetical protein